MSDASLRVALLARTGDACDRIGEALRQAGADVVLVADPSTSGPERVRETQPQAIVVALEPAIEDALDGFESVLADPAYLVIFEEAELAAQRAGWDAARWLRHLSAKLHRHADVLPPGAEHESDLQPSPGPLPERAQVVDLEVAIAAFTDEAQQHAEEVPRDTGLEGLHGAGPEDIASASAFDPVAFETSHLSLAAGDASAEITMPVFEGSGADDAGATPLEPLDLADDAIEAMPADDANADATPDAPAFDLSGLSLVDDAPGDGAPGDGADPAPADAGDTPGDDAAPDVAFDAADADAGTSGLTLADDAPPTSVPATKAAPDARVEALENRISGLSLADPDSYGHGPQRGAVLVEGGLGGPDAVRQLLAAIPAGFPRPVLVRLQLDGGRYDRLVKQMERAANLPVLLAIANQAAEPAHVYFMPPELVVAIDRGRLVFEAANGDAHGLPGSLPCADSAVLLLSGASRRLADAAMGEGWRDALVAGQSPEGSYDPDASLALVEHGGRTGTPSELVDMLVERWPPPGAPAPALAEGEPLE